MTLQRGFTLIEMAIVLVIMTILIGGLAMPLSAQIQARRIAETNRTLDEARDAILGFAMSHTSGQCTCAYSSGLLQAPPATTCPANLCPTSVTGTTTLTISSRHFLPCPDTDGDGIENRNSVGNCTQNTGWFPWVTLGVAAQDAWGNRLNYAVTDAFSRLAGFSNSDTGDLTVCNSSANAGTSDCTSGNVADKVPVVLLSHGPNGWGALNVNGNTLANPSSNDEQENANTKNTDTEFVSRSPSKAGDPAGEFDDLLRWISADQIRGRICPAGGCP
jgi:prepilin-type N-terminal cleavage/methylation domain-containing protein